ncbi:MAG: hypothetical protein ACHP7H_00660 [Hyphomicrobiales bacterium]
MKPTACAPELGVHRAPIPASLGRGVAVVCTCGWIAVRGSSGRLYWVDDEGRAVCLVGGRAYRPNAQRTALVPVGSH